MDIDKRIHEKVEKRLSFSTREELNSMINIFGRDQVYEWIVEFMEENYTGELETAIEDIYKDEVVNGEY